MHRRVLISWIAVNNDPFECDQFSSSFRDIDGAHLTGPTLAALYDSESPYAGSFSDCVYFFGKSVDSIETRESRGVQQTLEELKASNPSLRIHLELWDGDVPTDHAQIFEFPMSRLPVLRRKFPNRELVFHVSPGTRSMQTVLVLMGETGLIDPPFSLVKSYRREE